VPTTPQELLAACSVLRASREEEKQGSLAGAVDVLARGAEAQPSNAVLQVRLGVRLRAMGRYVEGLAAIRRAQSLAPDDRYILLELGTTLRMDTRVDEALRVHDALVRRFPDDADVVSGWVLDNALVGDPERGFPRAMALVAAHRGRLDLATTLARVLVAMGRHDEAARRCREVLEREPRAFSTWYVLALAMRGRRDDATHAEAVRAAWALNERSAQSLFLKGEAAEIAGDPDEAVFWHGEALSTHARFYLSSLALGRLHARAERMDEARDRLREAAAMAPWDGRAKGTYMRFRIAAGEKNLSLERVEAEALRVCKASPP